MVICKVAYGVLHLVGKCLAYTHALAGSSLADLGSCVVKKLAGWHSFSSTDCKPARAVSVAFR